jgi:serine/threonine protein kinase
MASSSSNVVGVHYRVGKKIGEGSFGVIFEGTNLLNNQQVAIKFVSRPPTAQNERTRRRVPSRRQLNPRISLLIFIASRNPEKATLPNSEMSTAPTRFSSAAVRMPPCRSRSYPLLT